MAAPRNAATPDRHSRLLLAAAVVSAALMFVWLVVGLVAEAFA